MAVNAQLESVKLHVPPDHFTMHLVAGRRNGGNVWRHGVTKPLGQLCQTQFDICISSPSESLDPLLEPSSTWIDVYSQDGLWTEHAHCLNLE